MEPPEKQAFLITSAATSGHPAKIMRSRVSDWDMVTATSSRLKRNYTKEIERRAQSKTPRRKIHSASTETTTGKQGVVQIENLESQSLEENETPSDSRSESPG
jgi:hypothetical protein